MANFKFSLEQVLKFRTQSEQQAKVELARVEKERLREEQRIIDIKQALDEQNTRLCTLKPEEFADRWIIENFIKGLRYDLIEAQKHLQYWQQAVKQAKEVLTQKALDKKVLEKLKEKQAEKYAHEEKLQEQKFFDEITAGKSQRNNPNG